MKHRLGNSPKCISCFFYREKEAGDKCRGYGWCTNKKHLAVGVNGHKREKPPEREAVQWMHSCRLWEDAENRLTHYEVLTRQPEPWKTEEEQERVRQLLREAEGNECSNN